MVIKKGPGGRSANAAIPCAVDIFERVLDAADVVITGAADCGSCTAYSVHDAISFEKAGKPAVVVTTTKFQPIAATMSADFGMPDVRTLVLPHPLGGTDRDTLWRWADEAVERLEALFVDGIATRGDIVAHETGRAVLRSELTGAIDDMRALVQADGSDLELIELTDDHVLRMRLRVDDAECADCVMPTHVLEATALRMVRATDASIQRVEIIDPR
jgi:hypothetical protein